MGWGIFTVPSPISAALRSNSIVPCSLTSHAIIFGFSSAIIKPNSAENINAIFTRYLDNCEHWMLVIFSFSIEAKKSYLGLELLPAPLKMNDLLRFKSMATAKGQEVTINPKMWA